MLRGRLRTPSHLNRVAAAALLVVALILATPGEACTSLVLDAETGHLLAANLESGRHGVNGLVYINSRNLAKQGWQPGITGEIAQWTSRFGSLTFNFYGWQYPWAGMNEAGLVISTMAHSDGTSVSLFDDRPQLDSGAWIQYLLDTCATLDDIESLPAFVRMGSTVDHYLVTDHTGEVGIIEFIDRQMHLQRGEDVPFPILSNSTYQDAVTYVQSGDYLQVDDCGRLVLDFSSSNGRFLMAADRIHKYPQQTETDSAVYYAFNSLALIGKENVRWSLVFDPLAETVLFRTSENPHIRWIDLRTLDFSCSQDGATLDIQADLHGDVSGFFQPFSVEATLDHFRWFQSYWGTSPPPIFRELQGAFDGFPCSEVGKSS